MAKKLGYTWYPKNWKSSNRVFRLTLSERGFYRELIDMAMESDNKILPEFDIWARSFWATEDELKEMIEKFKTLVDKDDEPLIKVIDNKLFIPSCEPRLNLIRGGSNGGKKSRKNKPMVKPSYKPTHKPMVKQREIEIERENKKEIVDSNSEEKIVSQSQIAQPKPKRDLSERQKNFYQSLVAHVTAYGKQTVRAFYEYWSEPNKSKTKMRWELQKTWDLERRLNTWKGREPQFIKQENATENNTGLDLTQFNL